MRKEILRWILTVLLIVTVVHAQSIVTTSTYWDTYEHALPTSPRAGVQRWYANSSTHQMDCETSGGGSCTSGSVPSGSIVMTLASACPTGYSESASLNGFTLIGTVAANMDVGTTGGSNNVTPTGTNATAAFTPAGTVAAPTFTGTPGTVPAETFTGNSGTVPAQTITWPVGVPTFSGSLGTTSSVSGGTPAGTNSGGAFSEGAISWPVGVPTFAGNAGTVPAEAFTGTPFSSVINHTHTVTVTYNVQGGTTAATTGTHVMTSTATGGSARAPTSGDVVSATTANPAGGVASITPAGTNGTVSFTPAGTVAWPAGVPTIAAGSFTQPTFSGSALSGHTHTLTPAGTVAWPVGVPTNGTVSFTPAGSNGTVAFTPAGTNSIPAFTGTPGTVPAEAWTGNSLDNRSAFTKVIFCVKA